MEITSSGYGVMLVILICVLATANIIECRKRVPLYSFHNGAAGDSLVKDDKMVEQRLVRCRNLLIRREGISELESTLFRRRRIHKTTNDLPPETKQTLLDCLKKNLPFHVSSEESETSFEDWSIEYAQLLIGWPNAPRRDLAAELLVERAINGVPLPPISAPIALPPKSAPVAVSPVPAPAQVPAGQSKDLAPASNPSPNSGFSLPPSAPNKSISPSPQPTAKKNAPPTPNKRISPSPRATAKKDAPPTVNAKNQPGNNWGDDVRDKEIIIAVVATALTTFALVALLFICCLKSRSKRIGQGQKNDRPFQNSSLSEGSSQQFRSVVSSGKEEVTINGGNNLSLVKNMSMKLDSGSSLTKAQSSKEAPPPLPPPGPPPAPPPRSRPPAPPKTGIKKPSPLGPRHQDRGISNEGNEVEGESGAAKTKLKPLFWDKVPASPNQAMVWHDISSGSFQFNEEKIESLFGYTPEKKNPNERGKSNSESSESSVQYIQIIDTRKAQNLSIILRALNLTSEEVVDALQEGNELPVELLQTLLKMAPTTDEELKLRLFQGDISQLGPAERFLKTLVDIPSAFKRIEILLFTGSHQEDISTIKDSFKTLEVACNKLTSSRLFLKLLEAVLKTGNRMNDGTYRGGAQAFKLDTLLKLADVKGTDGKTTLLLFVVQEIIRSEGIKAARASQSMSSLKSEEFVDDPNPQSAENYRMLGLKMVSGLITELEDVKKASVIDADSVTATVTKLNTSLMKTKAFLEAEKKNMEEKTEFYHAVTKFVERAETDIAWLLEEEKRIMTLVKNTADYFHGNSAKDEGLRLFTIVRDFLIMLDKTCKEVRVTMKPRQTSRKETLTPSPSRENRQPLPDMHKKLFPAISDRRMDFSSSDDES